MTIGDLAQSAAHIFDESTDARAIQLVYLRVKSAATKVIGPHFLFRLMYPAAQ
jgi:hypothetical protein